MEALLDVLRGRQIAADLGEAAWREVFALAVEDGVLPTLVGRLRSESHPSGAKAPHLLALDGGTKVPPYQDIVSLPVGIQSLLTETERQVAIDGFFWSQQLRGLLEAFAAAEIPVLPLKGPFLAERLYGNASRRATRDLDLLVRRVDRGRAGALLTTLGFTRAAASEDYQQSWLRETTLVELHFDVENPLAFDFDIASAWERATLASFQGQPAWKFHPRDEFLYLCLHGVHHRYQRLSYLLDVARSGQLVDLSTPPRPQAVSLERLAVLGRALATRLLPDEPLKTLPAAPSVEARMQALADELWQQLVTQSEVTLDWAAQHAFFLRTELTVRARIFSCLQFVRILMTRTVAADYTFAARFGLRRPWQVRVLRHLRILTGRDGRASV